MDTLPRTRRSVVKSLILSLGAAAGLWRFLTPRQQGRRPATLSVPSADVPLHGALVLSDHHCALVRDGSGARAVDLTCTHLGCTVIARPDGFVCPCHGSRFGTGGDVCGGPATQALAQLAIEQHDGVISVSRG